MQRFVKQFRTLIAATCLTLGLWSCGGWVQGFDPRRDLVADNLLDTTSQVTFLITGVQRAFSLAYGNAAIQAGGLSDELIFDARVPNATFPTYQLIDAGTPQLDNNSVSTLLTLIGNYRFLADTLGVRMERIAAKSDTVNDAGARATVRRGLFQSYL
ncbi:MAG: hypothetical protein ACOVSW_07795, partial [Candidatus Kapaibacteriota bacterium]